MIGKILKWGVIIVVVIFILSILFGGEDKPDDKKKKSDCGNGSCDEGETIASCPADCKEKEPGKEPDKDEWAAIRASDVAKTASGWSKPIWLQVNTPNWEDGAYISGDGDIVYYAYYPGDLFGDLGSGNVKKEALKIYKSEKPFTTKKKYSQLKKGDIFSEGGVMIAGNDIYYMTNEPTSDSDKDYDDNIYKNGELLPFNKPDVSEGDPHYCAAKNELYFWTKPSSSADTGAAGADIYLYKEGKVSKLPAPINTEDTADMQPFLNKACTKMYFTTNRGDVKSAGPAIYVSERLGEDAWGPVKPLVWSEAQGVGEPTLTDDEQTLFFVQLFKMPSGRYNSDIFYVQRT